MQGGSLWRLQLNAVTLGNPRDAMEPVELSLGEALRLALEGRFPEGWLYLPVREVTLATRAPPGSAG